MAPNLRTDANGHLLLTDANDLRGTSFSIKNHDLAVHGHSFLLDLSPNITTTPSSVICRGKPVADTTGCFLGFHAGEPRSRHVFPLGRIVGTRFMSIFRFKVWWTTHWTGTRGRDVEHETQLLLLDRSATCPYYVLLLPLLDGPFRASLQPGGDDSDIISVCLESGSASVAASLFRCAVYLHAGDDPYALVTDAIQVVRTHLGTFRTMEEKSPPPIVDKFGWCTWDAFYLTVNPGGVWEGVSSLAGGGCPPGMVLIDDGWQSICHDEEDPDDGHEGMNRTSAGEQMPCRLIRFEENRKFRDYESKHVGGETGMGAFVRDLKGEYPSVEHVYVWHALCGYWGGVRPGVAGMPEARVVAPRLSPGVKTTMEDLAVDKIVRNEVGLVAPERAGELYDRLHSHLRSAGIDGVKVDVIHILEMLCEDYGGRVELAKSYYRGLTASVKKHFNGNGVIASMEHGNDFMFLGTEAISLGRVGDDFWCTDPSGDPNGTYWLQGCHMVHCAYNSLWMGNFIHPDWDMFQSTHPCAAFHAASRAISGGPVYVSDSVGRHDFSLLRRLALPDGTILRCEHYALPTRDCLFEDPLQDGKTMLKIWNLNKFNGVLGAFNCQGGGWSREERRNKCAVEFSRPVMAKLRPSEVEWRNGQTPISTEGVRLYAVYLFQARKVVLLKPKESVELTLEPFDYELLTVSPVKASRSVQFAPIGLANMLNTGGAVQSVKYKGEPAAGSYAVEVGVKGAGEMMAYSSAVPVACMVNGEQAVFVYEDSLVRVQVPWSGKSSKLCLVKYLY